MGKRACDGQSQETRLRADVSASRFRLTRFGSCDSGVWNVASVEMFWIWTCLRGWFASWWSSKDFGAPRFLCAPLEQEECECVEICRAKRSLPRCPQINCELLQNEEFSLKYQAVGAVLVQEAAVLGFSYASSYLVRSAVQYASPHLHHYTKRKEVYNFNGLLP